MQFHIMSFSILSFFTLSALTVAGVRSNVSFELSKCIKEVSTIQRHHKKITNRLLSLNPQAKSLRIKRKIAETAFKTSPPHLRPAFYAALQAVKVSQKILRATQLGLINAAHLEQQAFKGKAYIKGYRFKQISNGLKIVAYPKKSDSPSYKLKPRYSKVKSIKMHKDYDVTKKFPPIVSKLVKNKRGVIKCGATIQKKDQKLKVRLIEGK